MVVGTSVGMSIVDSKAMVEKHSEIAYQLLAAHVLSGCDTVSQWDGIEKVPLSRCWTLAIHCIA